MNKAPRVYRSREAVESERHYDVPEFLSEDAGLSECDATIRNIGWTLGNECPYRCSHCYSMSARRKGMDLSTSMIDRIISQLARLGVETVNLGGNEPLFTNGANPKHSLLWYIIEQLVAANIRVGLTTSGISLLYLHRDHRAAFALLNDVDISFDSPDADEHNRNRGASLYAMALEALRLCQAHGIDHTIIMCAMRWNFSDTHIDRILALAREHDSHIRINPLKPVEPQHMESLLSPAAFYAGFSRLLGGCHQVDLGEPVLAAACSHPGLGCPCGRTSFRIHSITPTGEVPISPCVYLHDYKVGNLLTDDIFDIVNSPQFRSFRRRNANPQAVEGCSGCAHLAACRGGCAARSYLHTLHREGKRTLYQRDPYCLVDAEAAIGALPEFPQRPEVPRDSPLVHRDYLCTWIGKPR